jgi:regulator of sirC expression with transglutaminase-like and TPR domain
VAAIRPGPPPVKKLGGKKLVIEYSGRESEVAARPAARAAEDPAIARARSAYLSGNQKLFAGDAEGAVRAYHQALGFYPGYVGGYRGLGLAYAQLGNTPKALDAFRTYVRTVPGARDVALIKKRIARLSGK